MRQQKLTELLAPIATGLGYEFIGCECLSQGKHSLLRIYIDKEGGVSIDNCTEVSRQFSAVLDVEAPLPGSYQLEVSSPGIDRPLFTIEQWQQAMGSEVKVKLLAAVDNCRQFKGTLQSISGDTISVQTQDKTVTFNFANVSKANIIGVVDFKKA